MEELPNEGFGFCTSLWTRGIAPPLITAILGGMGVSHPILICTSPKPWCWATFSWAYWPFACLIRRYVHLNPLPILSDYYFFMGEICLYILHTSFLFDMLFAFVFFLLFQSCLFAYLIVAFDTIQFISFVNLGFWYHLQESSV